MQNLVSIVEIPTVDLARAITFYQSLLNVTVEEVDMGETRMGVFPAADGAVNVVLINGEESVPSRAGVTVYLNAGMDLQPSLDSVEAKGGQVLLPKTEIAPEMGFFALFIDTEGNRVGLHSIR